MSAAAGGTEVSLEAAGAYGALPASKVVTDFLMAHKKGSLSELSREEMRKLRVRMEAIYGTLCAHSQRLLTELGVPSEGLLSPEDRILYDAEMKAVALREDHYP